MPVKSMGSTGPYLSINETAEILGVTISQVHVLHRRDLLEAHYPDGRKAGKRFLRDDVYTLLELRQQKTDFTRKLPQLVMKAVVASRRAEKRMDELMFYFGFNQEALGREKEEVVAFFLRVESALKEPRIEGSQEFRHWSQKMLAVTEEYLELVHLYTGEPEPWKVFLDFARVLADMAVPGSAERMYIDHARANLRNVAYFYVRSFKGEQSADRKFPNERYAGRLVQRLIPT